MSNLKTEFRAGWRDLLGATLGLAGGFACYSPITSLFFRALEGQYHWSKTAAAVSLIGLPVTAACLPFAGMLIDRFGVRSVTLASALCLAAGFVALASMDGSLALWYAASIALTVLSCATGPIGYTRVIAERFRASRGFALATVLLGVSATAVVMPLIINPVIAHQGWRAAYLLLAGIAVVAGGAAFLLIRPSGLAKGASPSPAPAPIEGASFSEAVKSPAYWLLSIAILLITTAGLGLVSQFQSVAMERGSTADAAAALLSSLALAVCVSRLIVGFALDRWRPTIVAAATIGLSALGLALLATPGVPVLIGAGLTGFGLGAELDLLSFFCARRFGMKRFGAIYGGLAIFHYLGIAAGGLMFAQVHDHTHSYQDALIAAAVMMGLAGVLFLVLRTERVVKTAPVLVA